MPKTHLCCHVSITPRARAESTLSCSKNYASQLIDFCVPRAPSLWWLATVWHCVRSIALRAVSTIAIIAWLAKVYQTLFKSNTLQQGCAHSAQGETCAEKMNTSYVVQIFVACGTRRSATHEQKPLPAPPGNVFMQTVDFVYSAIHKKGVFLHVINYYTPYEQAK